MKLKFSAKQAQMKTDIIDDPQVVEALIGGSAGGAKSFSMCLAMMIAATEYPGIHFVLGRKTLKSLRQTTVATLLSKVHPAFGIRESDFKYSQIDNEITYLNGSKITLVDLDYVPSDPDFARFGSLEFDWAFIDEAGEITVQAKDVLRSRLGRGEATLRYGLTPKLLVSANPANNFLRTEYYNPYRALGGGGFQKWEIGNVFVKNKKLPAYRAFLRMSVSDNPFIDRNYVETLKQLPDRERRRLLDGDWDYADNDRMLFPSELLDESTYYEMPEMTMAEKYNYLIGVDVGDLGTDSTVISIVQNQILIKQIKINLRESGIGKESRIDIGDFLANKIIYHAKSFGFSEKDAKRITIETNGVGASLRDALRRKKWMVTEYTAQTTTRSAMYYALHELMMDGKVKIYAKGDFDYQELRRQLSAHEYEMDGDRPKVIAKKILRKTLGCSPDLADSFAIALYQKGSAFELAKPKTMMYTTKVHL